MHTNGSSLRLYYVILYSASRSQNLMQKSKFNAEIEI